MSANKLTTPSRITKVIAVPRVRPALRRFTWDDASIPYSFSMVRDMTGGDEKCGRLSSSQDPRSSSRKWDGRSVISSQWALSVPATEKDEQIAEEAPCSDVPPAGWDVRYTVL